MNEAPKAGMDMYTATGRKTKSDEMATYAPLVRRIANQMMVKLPASVELDDLIQAGMMGLLDALSRYEETQGVQFEFYAAQRIRGAILDELRGSDWLPRGLRRNARTIEQAIQKLQQQKGRAPTETEIAAALNMCKRPAIPPCQSNCVVSESIFSAPGANCEEAARQCGCSGGLAV
ncbi:sigma-70 family RNA polymerase sigma factor, partial [Ralstonia sp. ASV6]|uniref:sigma-70 family RNA polymerase sigma factor n=1 Tax=Ralstonia sp. ASV6 TaxID=2795124 RepID=UPI0022B8806C